MRWMIFISILLVLTLMAGGCMSGTGNPVPPDAGPGTSSLTYGGRAIAIAVDAGEITTPFPEARELFIQGLTCSTQYARYNDSLGYFDQALDIDPDFTEAWYAKGVALHNLERYSEAVQCYDRALALDPQNAVVRSLKESAIADRGRHDEAADWYRNATVMDSR